jgi:hypothetical protein
MKSTVFLFLLILLSRVSFPQQKGSSSGAYNDYSEKVGINIPLMKNAPTIKLRTYPLELFPGQVYDGWWFNWSNGGTINGNLKEVPVVNWLNCTPLKFTSNGCSDIIPVKYSFVAPLTEGVYMTTVKDSMNNWDSVRVQLTVTKSPREIVNMKYGINKDSISYKNLIVRNPMNFDENNCVHDYFPVDTVHFSCDIFKVVNWLKFAPSSGKLGKDQILGMKTTLRKNSYDSTWVLFTSEYSSWPVFYHYFIKETEPGDYQLHFNGINVVSAGYLPNGSTKTLMYWVKFDTISTQAIGTHDYENHRFYLGIQSDNSLFAGLGNSFNPVTKLTLTPHKWYHFAMTTSEDLDSAYVYINATEVARFAYSFSGFSKANLYIGARNDSVNSFKCPVQGIIDEVQIWEQPLSRNEIIQYMFAPPAGNEKGLVIYFPFNEGWGDYTKNAVDNYVDGALYWEPQWVVSVQKPKNLADLTSANEEYVSDRGENFKLECNPNPFRNSAEITFRLPENGKVVLQLFDIRGKLIKTLSDSNLPYGIQKYDLHDAILPKGMYFIRLAFTNSGVSVVQSVKIICSDQ